MKRRVYLAGSLFNEAEIAQRIKEEKIINEKFPGFDVFNPITQPFNDKGNKPTAIEIYEGDTYQVENCEVFIADVSNPLDGGVFAELGIMFNRFAQGQDGIIICVNSDIRLKGANMYEVPPISMNHYVLGGIQKFGFLVNSFAEAMEVLEKYDAIHKG